MTPLPLRRRREVNELLRDAAALTFAHWRILTLITVAVVVPVEVAILGIGLGWISSGYESLSGGTVYLIDGIEYFVVTPLLTGMIAAVLLAAEAGEPPSAVRCIQRGLDLFVPLLVASALYLLLGAFGLLLLIVGAIYFLVRGWVVLPAVALDGLSPVDALRRSFVLTQGSFWRVFLAVIAINAGPYLVGIGVMGVFDALADSADAQALQLTGALVTEIAVTPFVVVATILLYLDLVARAAAPQAPRPS